MILEGGCVTAENNVCRKVAETEKVQRYIYMYVCVCVYKSVIRFPLSTRRRCIIESRVGVCVRQSITEREAKKNKRRMRWEITARRIPLFVRGTIRSEESSKPRSKRRQIDARTREWKRNESGKAGGSDELRAEC